MLTQLQLALDNIRLRNYNVSVNITHWYNAMNIIFYSALHCLHYCIAFRKSTALSCIENRWRLPSDYEHSPVPLPTHWGNKSTSTSSSSSSWAEATSAKLLFLSLMWHSVLSCLFLSFACCNTCSSYQSEWPTPSYTDIQMNHAQLMVHSPSVWPNGTM